MKEIKLYKVEMITSNPSANRSGYFSTLSKAEEEVSRMKKVVSESEDYFGKTEFEITEVKMSVDTYID